MWHSLDPLYSVIFSYCSKWISAFVFHSNYEKCTYFGGAHTILGDALVFDLCGRKLMWLTRPPKFFHFGIDVNWGRICKGYIYLEDFFVN